jgi:hypothetical protein
MKTSNARAIGYLIGRIASPGFGLIPLPFQRHVILRQIASAPCGLILLAGYFDSEKNKEQQRDKTAGSSSSSRSNGQSPMPHARSSLQSEREKRNFDLSSILKPADSM